MFSEVTVDVDGQEITLNLCATTQGTFVSIKKEIPMKCREGIEKQAKIFSKPLKGSSRKKQEQ